jgi:hypothetical protein
LIYIKVRIGNLTSCRAEGRHLIDVSRIATALSSLSKTFESDPEKGPVPTANPTLVTIACESADYRSDEGLVQLALVRSGRPVPVTGGAASRKPGPATPAQCVAA